MTDELVSIKTVTVVAGRSAGDENPVLGGKKVVIELVPASYKASERDHYLVRHNSHTHTPVSYTHLTLPTNREV